MTNNRRHKPKLMCKHDEDFEKGIQHLPAPHQLLLRERRQREKELIALISDPVIPKEIRWADAAPMLRQLNRIGELVNIYKPPEDK